MEGITEMRGINVLKPSLKFQVKESLLSSMNNFVLMVYDALPSNCKSRDKDWMISRMNTLGASGKPFFFMIDFLAEHFVFCPEDEFTSPFLMFDINGKSNHKPIAASNTNPIRINKEPISFDLYAKKFASVRQEIKAGNTFLINLTAPTPIQLNHSLSDVYARSAAAYKLLIPELLLVFSPETFVRIKDGIIESHPMKGTIDANLPEAEKQLLNNPKEEAEHYTIVDLIRNDLSMVARDVKVEEFRYIQKIFSSGKPLLQASSRISGRLPQDYALRLGDIILKLLPAGSISGAPKEKTVEIIKATEQYDRGFYTGIMGYWDGKNLDTGVMIRYIEYTENGLLYKSGGGITWDSKAEDEYQELIDKVYVPAI